MTAIGRCRAVPLGPARSEVDAMRPMPIRAGHGSVGFAGCTLAVIKKFLGRALKKLNEQPTDFLWLLLFNPVSGSVNKMDAAHLRTGGALHPLKRARHQENAPVAFTANEQCGDVDRTSRIRLQVRGKSGPRTPKTLKATLKPRPLV